MVLSDIMPLTINATLNEETIQIQHKTASASNLFFGLKNKDDVAMGSFVSFHPKAAEGAEDEHQHWIRTYAQEKEPGIRFKLRNKKSDMYLYADWHGYFTNGHIKKTLDGITACKLS